MKIIALFLLAIFGKITCTKTVCEGDACMFTEICQDTQDRLGVCRDSAECSGQAESKSGFCKFNFNVCCLEEHKCGGHSSSIVSYFQNYEYPAPVETGTLCSHIVKIQENICHVQLNFIQFSMGPSQTRGECLNDFLTIIGGSDGIRSPLLCGNLDKHSVTIPVLPGENLILGAGVQTLGGIWNIEIVQVRCNQTSTWDGVNDQCVKSFNRPKREAFIRSAEQLASGLITVQDTPYAQEVNYKGLDLVIGGRYPDQRHSYLHNNQATSNRNIYKTPSYNNHYGEFITSQSVNGYETQNIINDYGDYNHDYFNDYNDNERMNENHLERQDEISERGGPLYRTRGQYYNQDSVGNIYKTQGQFSNQDKLITWTGGHQGQSLPLEVIENNGIITWTDDSDDYELDGVIEQQQQQQQQNYHRLKDYDRLVTWTDFKNTRTKSRPKVSNHLRKKPTVHVDKQQPIDFNRIPTSHEKRRPISGGLRPVVINNALKYVPESKFNFRNKFEDSVLISRRQSELDREELLQTTSPDINHENNSRWFLRNRNKIPARKPSHKIEDKHTNHKQKADHYYTNRNIIGENNNSKKVIINNIVRRVPDTNMQTSSKVHVWSSVQETTTPSSWQMTTWSPPTNYRLNPSRGGSGFTIWGPGNSKLNFIRSQEVRTKREGSDLSFEDIFSSAVNLEPESADYKLKTQYLNPLQLPTTLKSQSKNKPDNQDTSMKMNNDGITIEKITNSEGDFEVEGHQLKEFPFLVGILSEGALVCTGVVISQFFILSSASCVLTLDINKVNYVSSERGNLSIKTIHLHPGWDRLNGKNDFGLIETQTPMEDQICLLNEKIDDERGSLHLVGHSNSTREYTASTVYESKMEDLNLDGNQHFVKSLAPGGAVVYETRNAHKYLVGIVLNKNCRHNETKKLELLGPSISKWYSSVIKTHINYQLVQ